MGRLLLFLVAASILTTGVVYASRGLDSSASGTALQQDHLADAVAQRLSETGLAEGAEALSRLSVMPLVLPPLRGAMMGGTYTVTFSLAPPDRVVMTSTARVDGVGREGGRHERVAVYRLVAGEAPSVPPPPAFLAQAMTIEQSLTMNGSQRIVAEDPAVNANVHTNGGSYANISENAGIQGFYHAVSPLGDVGQRNRLRKAFTPNRNPDGLDVYQLVDRIEIPRVVASSYITLGSKSWPWQNGTAGALPPGTRTVYTNANVQHNGGVLDFSGMSSAEDPAVWVIKGDFNLNGGKNLEIRGFVNIVTQGNVNINGFLKTASGSTLSLYSERDISVNGSAVISGSLMNNQNIQLSGGTEIHGPVTTRGTVNFNGNSKIVYTPLSGNMTKPLFGGPVPPVPGGGGLASFRPLSVRG